MTINRLHFSLALLTVGLLLLWLGMLLLGTGSVDHTILVELYSGRHPFLTAAARFWSFFGSGTCIIPVVALSAILLALRKRRWSALVLVVGTGIGRLLVELQKYELNRLRPEDEPHLVLVQSLSFPSAHAATSMMVYLTIALMVVRNPRQDSYWVAAAVVLALLIGLSRVMLGVHWPSDVIGGWSFGLVWALLLYAISRHKVERGGVA